MSPGDAPPVRAEEGEGPGGHRQGRVVAPPPLLRLGWRRRLRGGALGERRVAPASPAFPSPRISLAEGGALRLAGSQKGGSRGCRYGERVGAHRRHLREERNLTAHECGFQKKTAGDGVWTPGGSLGNGCLFSIMELLFSLSYFLLHLRGCGGGSPFECMTSLLICGGCCDPIIMSRGVQPAQ